MTTELRLVTYKQNWRDRAACRGTDPDLFFPPNDASVAAKDAKMICSNCPVLRECYDAAEPYGIFGGTTESDRVRIKRGRCRVEEVWAETNKRFLASRRWDKALVLKLHDNGSSVVEIAATLDAPRSTIWSIVKRAERQDRRKVA